ncbi:type II toxin-antitoxin system Phd/YefM family antitoxin [Nesterenkonia ebinurensis]|uniref:type II toxin-antitoxin system Phd/YefM family antitoxin n=1 Tax=Nesterenkonia ebinurensis TaxID=2608252 RepID=UPI00123D73C1|nr:type II toxin-antitoxin system prevent-host-death family antitoxin [Nesterenkonia ebinurensis]
MGVTKVNMHQAKSQLSQLVEKALAGERVVIARAGEPVVDLVAHKPVRVTFGLGKHEAECDPEIFDGTDQDINELFYQGSDQ